MAKYEKWLGAGLGFAVGGPLGGILGFITGSMMDKGQNSDAKGIAKGVTEFEVNMIVLASHLVKVDGKVSLSEINFLERFFNTHFDEKFAAERRQVIHHCLQKEYDLGVACDQLRVNTTHGTRTQVVRFMFDVAQCDGDLSDRENYFIFKIAGYLNINDVDFKKIKTHLSVTAPASFYEILEVRTTASMAEIRTSYRKLVLKYHPDRNKEASETERKKLAQKFQQIQEAYEKLKEELEGR